MNREQAFQALNGLNDRYITEAIRYAPDESAGAPERIVKMKKKRIVAIALAAALLLALGIGAYAVGAAVASPEAAEKVAREQMEEWKALGLISPDFVLEGPPDQIVEIEESEGGDYWYGRIFRHRYDVRWYFGRDGGAKYGCSLGVDTLSGKITMASFYAVADENDEPVSEVPVYAPDGSAVEEVWYLYDNFDDLFPADRTLDQFCEGLAGYWGFSGYHLGDTEDEFYHSRTPAPDGATRLVDLPRSNGRGSYVTIYFDGDPDGAPMYLELNQFAGHVCMNVGTGHAVG